jgi:hypothetical protein
VRQWRRRDNDQDASHRPHRLHTTLTPAQELVVIELRKTLLLPLDDLLAVTREFLNPERVALGFGSLPAPAGRLPSPGADPQPEDDEQPQKTFKDYEPGFVHVDVKYLPRMPDEDAHRYLFVGIDRASRWVYVEILGEKTAANAAAFFQRLIAQGALHGAKSPDR